MHTDVNEYFAISVLPVQQYLLQAHQIIKL